MGPGLAEELRSFQRPCGPRHQTALTMAPFVFPDRRQRLSTWTPNPAPDQTRRSLEKKKGKEPGDGPSPWLGVGDPQWQPADRRIHQTPDPAKRVAVASSRWAACSCCCSPPSPFPAACRLIPGRFPTPVGSRCPAGIRPSSWWHRVDPMRAMVPLGPQGHARFGGLEQSGKVPYACGWKPGAPARGSSPPRLRACPCPFRVAFHGGAPLCLGPSTAFLRFDDGGEPPPNAPPPSPWW